MEEDPINEAFILSSQGTDMLSDISQNDNKELKNKKFKVYIFISFELLLFASIITLTILLVKKIDKNDELTEKKKGLEKQNKNFTDIIRDKNDEISKKNKEIEDKEKNINNLTEINQDLERNKTALNKEIGNLKDINSDLLNEKEALSTQIYHLNQEILILELDLNKLTNEKNRLVTENKNLENEIQTLQKNNTILVNEKKALETQIQKKDSQIKDLNTKVQNLTNENKNLKETISTLQKENKLLTEFKTEVEEKIPNLKKDEKNNTIVIEKNNLSTEMTTFIKNATNTFYEKYKTSENFTNNLKKEVKDKYDGKWICVSGYQFYKYYDTFKYIFSFTIGQMNVLLLGS